MTERYLPHTDEEITAILNQIGVSSLEDLFSGIPSEARLNRPLSIPSGASEIELRRLVNGLANANWTGESIVSFLGAGAYAHASPAVISALLSRGEFLTAYTPYQPEVSQGTLQAIFEYQTLMASLLAMDVSNASNYDGSTALAEAALMAERITGKKIIAYGAGLHPEYLQVLKTYIHPRGFELVEIPLSSTGTLDLAAADAILKDKRPAALAVQYPNALGCLDDMSALAALIHAHSGLFISATTDLTAYGLLTPPGEFGADIAVGEGQGLGLPLNFGGPYLGVLATKREYIRMMPGRLVGKTKDLDGKVAYTLTLSTREQHIRREKATSNICTNQGLCALAVTIYLGLMGKAGLAQVAEHSVRRAHGLAKALVDAGCGRLTYAAPFFHEFVLELPKSARAVVDSLKQQKIIPGLDLGRWNSAWQNRLLINTTEIHSEADCQRLITALKEELS